MNDGHQAVITAGTTSPTDLCRVLPSGQEKGEQALAKKPVVNKDECISCGICKTNCPEVFRFDAHGKSECYDPDGATEEVIQSQAIDLCPVSCISWEE
jgi:ferredoxin